MMRIPPPAGGVFRLRHLVLPIRLATVIFIGAVCVFLVIAAGVTVDGPSVLPLYQKVAAWFHVHRTPGLTAAMHLATGLGSAAWVAGVALCVALVLTTWRRWYGLLAFAVSLPRGMILSGVLKTAFHRARSGPETWSSSFHGYGFPSGHTMAATLLYGALAACAFPMLATRRVRAGAVFGAIALVGLVAFSRLALGAHYLSDVVAAAAAGLAWLAFCFTAEAALRRGRGRVHLPLPHAAR